MSSPSRNGIPQDPVAMSSSPGLGQRLFSSSLPREEVTARLAEPVRSASPMVRSGSPRPGFARPEGGALGEGPAFAQGPGVSALAAALSDSLGQTPPRHGTPPARVSTPPVRPLSPAGVGRSATPTNYGSFDSRGRAGAESTGPYEDPEIVKRHLVRPSEMDNPASEASSETGKGKQTADFGFGTTGLHEDEFSSLRLQGGDVTRGIYKWTEQAEAKTRMQRSKSFDHSRPEPESDTLDINSIKVPGGFRRNHLRRNVISPSGHYENGYGGADSPGGNQRPLFTSSFLEFLSIYGHFAGEELEEDDEVLGPNEYFQSGEDNGEEGEEEPMEDSALLGPSKKMRKRKVRGGSGQNSQMNAALLLLKSFVGTGVLFLPRAYLNGGMLFSNIVLLGVALLSYYCFVLLVTTRLSVEGSFGDMGGILYGKWMRAVILASIVLSQIGFVAAYIVFTSENLQAFILAVTDCQKSISIPMLIIMQMVVFLPFSLLRDIGKLGFTALIADAFILIGLAYLFYYDVLTLAAEGLADIIMFNQRDWTLFIGTAIFTFEGIGLIIPIQESMKQPEKFPKVMFLVMVIITVLFTVMGAISYAAYGSQTQTVVLLNLPQDNRMVNVVQLLYSVAILLSTPLQIFPAIRIAETELFTRSGKYNPWIKWQKNIFRFFVVMLCAAIAWGGADNLDKFVALVGNFACIPLVYIYPPLLHLKAVARNKFWRYSDIGLCIFGFIAMAYTTSLTIMSWANSEPKAPGYCDRRASIGRQSFSSKPTTTLPPPPRPFPTVPTCPSPTCACADTPAMPDGLEIDRLSPLEGVMAGYAEHVVVCTGRDDWESRIEEENSGDNLAADLKELFGRGGKYVDPFHNISVINSSFPSSAPPRRAVQSTSVYLLPSFKYVPFLPRVSFDSVEALAKGFLLPEKLHPAHDGLSPVHRDRLTRKEAFQGLLVGVQDVTDVLVLICGHGGRDMRCGAMGPVLRGEFEEKLERQGFAVAKEAVQAGGLDGSGEPKRIQGSSVEKVARVGLISHIGGHKFAGNVIVYIPSGFAAGGGDKHPLAGCGIWYGRVEPKHVEGIPTVLNAESFVPYTITSREAISPTSFVFTVSPHSHNPSLPYLAPSTSSWRYPLWSVEFKQPQVQIARHYTPLPPREGQDASDGSLRFYVRAIGGGEMSTYLSRLGVGRDVWLRGPHVGFHVTSRLGSMSNVVFLAGGTGVVPAMQVAEAVLEQSPEARVSLLWAVRKREELQHVDGPVRRPSWWRLWLTSTRRPMELPHELQNPSPIARQLEAIKATYGDRLRIQVAIDEEQTQFRESDLQNAISSGHRRDLSPRRAVAAPGCRLHDPSMLEMAPEFETPAAADGCECGAGAGKNLFMVSGSDGFIAHYAGPKRWLGGQQVQGP
ncbi:Vacuolar amino acid transporter 3, partial [Trichoderma cornu-damae]